jgi:hypothetical protein
LALIAFPLAVSLECELAARWIETPTMRAGRTIAAPLWTGKGTPEEARLRQALALA